MESEQFKGFWEKMATPAHAHSSDDWFDRYSEEILFYLSGAKTVVDAGCGSGEVLSRIARYFTKVIGMDYSKSMLERARAKLLAAGLENVELYCDNITAIRKYCDEPVDAIYSNGVIQYLSVEELRGFLNECRSVLKPGGKVILLNIPNINNRMLFMLGFYKHEDRVSFFRVLKGLPRLWLKMLKFRMSNSGKYDDGIGNWFSITQIRQVASTNGFTPRIYGASVVNYYYRFHAVLTNE